MRHAACGKGDGGGCTDDQCGPVGAGQDASPGGAEALFCTVGAERVGGGSNPSRRDRRTGEARGGGEEQVATRAPRPARPPRIAGWAPMAVARRVVGSSRAGHPGPGRGPARPPPGRGPSHGRERRCRRCRGWRRWARRCSASRRRGRWRGCGHWRGNGRRGAAWSTATGERPKPSRRRARARAGRRPMPRFRSRRRRGAAPVACSAAR